MSYQRGGVRGFDCHLHAIFEPPVPDEIEGYGIDWVTTVTEEELGHENIVAFGDSGNSVYALDYGVDEPNPPVVFIDADMTAANPESKIRLASSVTEFFAKFEADDE
ncbi:SMI1/KNR4 family protein [Natrinema gari]|uniref:SMI1/KNR4 family protein n=1 Tax=Natrinema gari TaxID=419186 RepID=UPI0012679F21|nr:SMI1/KNR4 family protein [Natrinema gari]